MQAQEKLPMHEVESQATADPSVLNLQDNPREASVHPQGSASTRRLGADHGHVQACGLCGAAKPLTHISFYGDSVTQWCK